MNPALSAWSAYMRATARVPAVRAFVPFIPVIALWAIVVLKLVGAIAPLVFAGVGADRLPAWTRGRWTRVLGWIAAIGLALYGSVLTVAGLLVEAGVVEPAADADEHALAWHTYLWDPWFALWGASFVVTMWRTRPRLAQAAEV